MNTHNDPPPKFGWFGLRAKMRALKQMYKFHSTWNAHEAQKQWYRKGKAEGLKQAPTIVYGREIVQGIWPCEHDSPLIAICPGLFACPACRKVDTGIIPVARPTVNLALLPEPERHTGPIYKVNERPVFANARKWHPDDEAGPATQHTRAIRVKGKP